MASRSEKTVTGWKLIFTIREIFLLSCNHHSKTVGVCRNSKQMQNRQCLLQGFVLECETIRINISTARDSFYQNQKIYLCFICHQKLSQADILEARYSTSRTPSWKTCLFICLYFISYFIFLNKKLNECASSNGEIDRKGYKRNSAG